MTKGAHERSPADWWVVLNSAAPRPMLLLRPCQKSWRMAQSSRRSLVPAQQGLLQIRRRRQRLQLAQAIPLVLLVWATLSLLGRNLAAEETAVPLLLLHPPRVGSTSCCLSDISEQNFKCACNSGVAQALDVSIAAAISNASVSFCASLCSRSQLCQPNCAFGGNMWHAHR